MAFNNSPQLSPLATKLIEVEANPADATARTATSDDNVTGAAPGFIHMVEIDNHLNAEDTFVKFRFDTAAGTLSTAECHIQLLAPAKEVINYAFPGGMKYTTGLSVWIVTSAVLGATTMPLNMVRVKILAT